MRSGCENGRSGLGSGEFQRRPSPSRGSKRESGSKSLMLPGLDGLDRFGKTSHTGYKVPTLPPGGEPKS